MYIYLMFGESYIVTLFKYTVQLEKLWCGSKFAADGYFEAVEGSCFTGITVMQRGRL